jgi:hypothetical protein
LLGLFVEDRVRHACNYLGQSLAMFFSRKQLLKQKRIPRNKSNCFKELDFLWRAGGFYSQKFFLKV